MNRTTASHLNRARHHLREAFLSLLPAAPGKRLRTIERECRALIVESLGGTATPPASESASGSRRITIEE
ncbi:hypothetical protein [Arachnia propionica]|uniref:hypothetical protein n=1 Tax=Arachnia propionica TaxID=1750 RepID=UPI00163B0DAA|nr:hypothetical protein [Arachnia propionica]